MHQAAKTPYTNMANSRHFNRLTQLRAVSVSNLFEKKKTLIHRPIESVPWISTEAAMSFQNEFAKVHRSIWQIPKRFTYVAPLVI